MLHPALSTSSTLRAKPQRPRFPGCPQLHTTNGSPLQGSCHFWDPHISILILNFPLIQMGSQSICGLVSNHFSSSCSSTALQPCWLPCYSEHACQACSHLRVSALLFPLLEMLFPSYLTHWLPHIQTSTLFLSASSFFPLIVPYLYPSHWYPVTFLVSWHVLDAQ